MSSSYVSTIFEISESTINKNIGKDHWPSTLDILKLVISLEMYYYYTLILIIMLNQKKQYFIGDQSFVIAQKNMESENSSTL